DARLAAIPGSRRRSARPARDLARRPARMAGGAVALRIERAALACTLDDRAAAELVGPARRRSRRSSGRRAARGSRVAARERRKRRRAPRERTLRGIRAWVTLGAWLMTVD